MPNVIDSLVVTLGLDPAKFGAGISASQKQLDKFDTSVKKLGIDEKKLDDQQKKALKSLRELATQSTRTTKELGSTASAGSELWGVMEKGALAFGAALGLNALKDFTVQSIQANAAMTRLGPNIGIAAKEADAWGKAVEKAVGGNRGAAVGSLQGISNQLAGTSFGAPPTQLLALAAIASRYNGGKPISVFGANGRPRSAESVMLDLADPLKAMGPQRAQALGAQFGLDSDTVNFLDRGRGAVESDLADARKKALDQGGFDEDEKVRKAATDLAQAMEHLKDVLVVLSAPALLVGLKNFTAWVTWFQDHDSAKFNATVRANDAALHASKDDPDGKKWLASRDAESALALVKDPGQSWAKGGNASFWTDDQKKARLAQLLADGETMESAAAVVTAEMAAGRSPGAQTGTIGIGAGSGISDALMDRVKQVESGGRPNAVSPAGALGAYQLMPATARALGVDPMNEGQARGGARTLLGQLLAHYGGDRRKALAAYNWNQRGLDADIASHGDAWASYLPHETAAYLPKFADLVGGGAAGSGDANGDTTIHQNGQVVINVPSGDPHAIAQGWHKAIVAQAQTGPS